MLIFLYLVLSIYVCNGYCYCYIFAINCITIINISIVLFVPINYFLYPQYSAIQSLEFYFCHI